MKEKSKIEIVSQKYVEHLDEIKDGYKFFGERIKKLRKQMGYSKIELAKRSGVDRSTIVRYENGEYRPKAKTLVKILNALYCDVIEFCENKQRGKFEALIKKTYIASEDNNIFKIKQDLDDKLSHAVSYKCDGKNVPVPKDIITVIRENLDASFKMLELLDYDEEQ